MSPYTVIYYDQIINCLSDYKLFIIWCQSQSYHIIISDSERVQKSNIVKMKMTFPYKGWDENREQASKNLDERVFSSTADF